MKTLLFDWVYFVSVTFFGGARGKGSLSGDLDEVVCVENIVARSHGTSYLIFWLLSLPTLS